MTEIRPVESKLPQKPVISGETTPVGNRAIGFPEGLTPPWIGEKGRVDAWYYREGKRRLMSEEKFDAVDPVVRLLSVHAAARMRASVFNPRPSSRSGSKAS